VDEGKNGDENQERTAFQTRNRLGLPDVTFRFSGEGPNARLI